jgi:K+-transporting ATPase ATPase C chain
MILDAFRMLVALTLLTGVLYPVVVTGIARVAFPHQATGSVIERDGQVVGSSLIGQQFTAPGYFWGRLSATSPPYNGGASTGSNYGPLNPALTDAAKARIDALRAADPSLKGPIPVDLVTASGSGLDPHISIAAARIQVPRVAWARGMSDDAVLRLVGQHATGRQLGVLGEPIVNVLELNLALDAASRN